MVFGLVSEIVLDNYLRAKKVMLHLLLLWQSLGCFFRRNGSLPAPSGTIHRVQGSVMLVCLYVLVLGGSRAAAEPTKAFLENPDPLQLKNAFAPGPPSLRSELKSINQGFLSQCQEVTSGHPVRVLLNLFKDTEYTVALEVRESLAPGRAALRGTVEGQTGSMVVLAYCNNALAGSVFIPGKGNFQIQHAGGGWHRITEIDGSRALPCSAGPRPSSPRPAIVPPRQPPSTPGRRPADAQTNEIIDLLVVYTGDALQGAGGADGMRALIDAAVAEANTALENSQIFARVRLVASSGVDYQETGDISEDLDNMFQDDTETDTDPGPLMGVHDLRRAYQADVVCMITETTGGPVGLAYLMRDVSTDFSHEAFSVVQRQYATAYYALAHELGHNMGCQHDRGSATGPGVYEFSYAYLFVVDGVHYHTVMAYQPGLPIPYFSNPNVKFMGMPTGVPEGLTNSANNAKTINLTAPTVAAFSSYVPTNSVPQLVTIIQPPDGSTFTLPAQVQVSATASNTSDSVKSVDFYVNGQLLATADNEPFTFVWTNGAMGTFILTAVAEDDQGLRTASTPVTVLFTNAPILIDVAGSLPLADGSFQLRFSGPNGQPFAIEASSNLRDWTKLTTNTFANPYSQFIDSSASGVPARFYRVILEP